MSASLLRFIHASDFCLHRCLSGVSDINDELRNVLTAAPIDAARGVFDAAIVNAVDFVVLSGGIVRAEFASPGALRFLLTQFDRLAQKNIRVYWAGGLHDGPKQWPAAVTLPDNVHHFAAEKVETLTHTRQGKEIAAIVGRSSAKEKFDASEFRPGKDGIFTIAIAHGEAASGDLSKRAIHYWALGGRATSASPAADPYIAHYPGCPQGFTPTATGKHGATLVNVSQDGEVRMQPVATDVVRWHNEQVSAVSATSDDDVYHLLAERITNLRSGAADKHLMIRWSLTADDHLRRQLNQQSMGKEIVELLREEFCQRKPFAWTCSLKAQAREDVPAELYEEETILGDFLRSLREYRQDKKKALDLDSQLTGDFSDSAAVRAIHSATDDSREQFLREIAALGVDMLGGAALAEAGTTKIQFSGADQSQAMTLKHDGQAWQAQQDLADLIDEELAS